MVQILSKIHFFTYVRVVTHSAPVHSPDSNWGCFPCPNTCIKSCELAHHFIQLSNTTHMLDKSSQSIYTEQLSKHLAIILIEHIAPDPNKDIQSLFKQREDYWQGALKSIPLFGGINKRTNRRKRIKS